MPPTDKTLLVPMQVEALVIDDKVIETALPTIQSDTREVLAGDGKWSGLKSNYHNTLKRQHSALPEPFFGATREFGTFRSAQLLLDDQNPALPSAQDRGVYLRWVLPPQLRHAPKDLDYPALPDQWLVVRIARRLEMDDAPQMEAWFIDSSLLTQEGAAILAQSGQGTSQERIVRGLGKVVNIKDYQPANHANSPRTTITALGNATTGSPTFSAAINENRHCLSWHDDLTDLRQDEALPLDLVLSYHVSGWYRDSNQDPLSSNPKSAETKPFSLSLAHHVALNQGQISPHLRREFLRHEVLLAAESSVTVLQEGTTWLIATTGSDQAFIAQKSGDTIRVTQDGPSRILTMLEWTLGRTKAPADLEQHHCLFHGMTAFINYWHAPTYKGPMLGYPGAPDAHGSARQAKPPLKVGIAHSAEDALVALAARGRLEADAGSASWKALEAVIYQQTEQLLEAWDPRSWFHRVHQNGFRPVEGGTVWSIRTKERGQGPLDPTRSKDSKIPRATDAQIQALRQLNQQQQTWDRLVRERQAYQQAFHAGWQRLFYAKNTQIIKLEDALEALTKPIESLVKQLATLSPQIDQQIQALETDLRQAGLLLSGEPAPRFWMPTDPVILLQNGGSRKQLRHEVPLPCRLPAGIATLGTVQIGTGSRQDFSVQPVSLPELKDFVTHFPTRAQTLTGLVEEALLVERLVHCLAIQSLPANRRFTYAENWDAWRKRIQAAFSLEHAEKTTDHLQCFDARKCAIQPAHLARIWGQQPWSPLFLDWEISWQPNLDPEKAHETFPGWEFQQEDFHPQGPPAAREHTFKGRSLMTPVDDRLFQEPLQTLRSLLHAPKALDAETGLEGRDQVAQVLRNYLVWWDQDLEEMQRGGLIGQTLSGFHQQLLGRDLHQPRFQPNPDLPWLEPDDSAFPDGRAADYLKRLAKDPSPLLAPPSRAGQLPFTLLRGGSLTIKALWLIDDFGQWADLLVGSSAGRSSGAVINPHAAWPQDNSGSHLVMPPRITQPARLHFRFAGEHLQEPPNPIRGWVFYNYLDQALAFCDSKGRLFGELTLRNQGTPNQTVDWSLLATDQTEDTDKLQQVVKPLTNPAALLDFLDLMDHTMARIRPTAEELGGGFMGRPLALVDAHLGLELFGHSWTDPRKLTSPSMLDALQLPVLLGDGDTQDGLLGFFRNGNFSGLTAAHGKLEKAQIPATSGFVKPPAAAPLKVGLSKAHKLVLLMDPRGYVTARCGLLPSKKIRLDPHQVRDAFEMFELSFQAGPLLISDDKLTLPTPPDDGGSWQFLSSQDSEPKTILPWQNPISRAPKKIAAQVGRLVLRRPHEQKP